MPRAIAINVAANTNLPGFRGPIYPDGTFAYVPIPERKPTRADATVPTYADVAAGLEADPRTDFDADPRTDLDADRGVETASGVDTDRGSYRRRDGERTLRALAGDRWDAVADRPVHLDPEFPTYPGGEAYTYGDEHGVKAGPLSKLAPGDSLFFYATLSLAGDPDDAADWIVPDWGAYLIAEFRVERALTGEAYEALPADERAAFANNAHVKRAPFDAKVLVAGGPGSRLFDRAVPLSAPDAGATANRLVAGLSNDSGKGPWWRRRFWYDDAATAELRRIVGERPFDG